MKQCFALILVLCILICCTACGTGKEPAPAFYYLRSNDTIQYGEPAALLAPVYQDITWDVPLAEMLQMYLRGPGEENYRSSVPMGTRLLRVTQENSILVLELSQEFSALDGIHLSLAGACLTATCHSLTGCEGIRVHSGENVYEFSLSDFVLLDEGAREQGKEP